MKRNEYQQRTSVLKIPVVGYKDTIWPDVEMRKWTVVENLLLAARKGIQNCIFRDGSYSIMEDNTVLLQATGIAPSAEGVVGGIYFNAPSRVTWKLPEGESSCYLYLATTVHTLVCNSEVRAVASVKKCKGKHVLCARVDIKNQTIDTSPKGKVLSGDVAEHIGVSENPHGVTLVQDILRVKRIEAKELILGGKEMRPTGKTLIQNRIEAKRLKVAGKEMRAPVVVDFETGGKEGVVVTSQDPVSFVQVSKSSRTGKMGEVSVGYFGSDDKSTKPEEFVVYNEGNSGVKARALVF